MRHKYPTRAIVLHRTPLGETSALLTLLTEDVGLVRARAQGVRKPGAKLSAALPTLAESEFVLVRGAEGWRVSGALLATNWFGALSRAARERAVRTASLYLRLVHGEDPDSAVFTYFVSYLTALRMLPEELHDAAECLAALRLLAVLGLDAGDIPGTEDALYIPDVLSAVERDRSTYIARVNRGLAASGL